uniref:Uncharacterized protein n=1 Tax=Anas platyrhynchos platyrhynchos TaxID=8840 RepID=A0A493THH1_ANAPP
GPAMQLTGAALVLCAARRAVASGKERRAQFASWDEVNVIAHGLLQLGHGLKEHVDRTKGQMRELGSRLSAHNSSMGRTPESRSSCRRSSSSSTSWTSRICRLKACRAR